MVFFKYNNYGKFKYLENFFFLGFYKNKIEFFGLVC